MPKIIISARNYPFSLLLGGLLFALTLFLTTQSIGKVNGAGGEDEGSGLGGTGKSGEFGGSGLGGTGAPDPFFGLNEDLERARQELDQAREELKPLTSPAWALDRIIQLDRIHEQTSSLAEIPPTPDNGINDSTQVNLNRLPGAENIPSNSPTIKIEVALPDPVPSPAQLHEMLSVEPPIQADEAKPEQSVELSSSTDSPATDQTQNQETTAEPILLDSTAPETNLAESGVNVNESSTNERLQAPERIQRPELPPLQRIRPTIDRSAIVPARPQPMRI
ncbi:MAG: hypothetical protein RQ757_07525 [Pseudomonadales bacterium]|nr:hypothetical protein [Pseudomonadales bacterium]